MMALTDDCLLYTARKPGPMSSGTRQRCAVITLHVEGDNGGPLLVKTLTEQVEARGVDVHEARALRLIVDRHGPGHPLLVLWCEKRGPNIITALKKVILCAGGFVMNAEMLERYDRVSPGRHRADRQP